MVNRKKRIIENLVPIFHDFQNANPYAHFDDSESVLLFFSLDIVNSTLYKSTNPNKWADVMSNILKTSISIFINSSSDDYLMWKSLGDEIIFTKTITSVSSISDSLDEIYNKLILINKLISDGIICDSNSAQILAIKATAWLANISNSGDKSDNISIAYQINDNRKSLDYIGPDIDIGFRIAKHSSANRLLISYEIAYFLLKRSDNSIIANRIHFVDCTHLKGVWNNAPYPIFCYHYDQNVTFYDSLCADCNFGSRIFDNYLAKFCARPSDEEYVCCLNSAGACQLNRKIPCKLNEIGECLLDKIEETGIDPKEFLIEIPNDRIMTYEEKLVDGFCIKMGLKNKINKLYAVMNHRKETYPRSIIPQQKVCYSIVCYTIDDSDRQSCSFLLAKKNDTWTNITITTYYNTFFSSFIKKYVYDCLHLDIELTLDSRYCGSVPVLIASDTQFNEHNTMIKHMTLLAKITSPISNVSSVDYDEIMLVNETDKFLAKEECSAPLLETLRVARQYVSDLEV